MHSYEALDDLFEVFPLLLMCVIVAISIDFRRQASESDSRVVLNCLDSDLFICHRVLEEDDAVIESWLLLQNDVGGQRRLSQLLLRLIKILLVLTLLLLEVRIVGLGHGVESLPSGDLTRLCILLDSNLLEATSCT